MVLHSIIKPSMLLLLFLSIFYQSYASWLESRGFLHVNLSDFQPCQTKVSIFTKHFRRSFRFYDSELSSKTILALEEDQLVYLQSHHRGSFICKHYKRWSHKDAFLQSNLQNMWPKVDCKVILWLKKYFTWNLDVGIPLYLHRCCSMLYFTWNGPRGIQMRETVSLFLCERINCLYTGQFGRWKLCEAGFFGWDLFFFVNDFDSWFWHGHRFDCGFVC